MINATRILFGPDWLSRRPALCISLVLAMIATIDYLLSLTGGIAP